jgi:predicted acyl esterase
MSPTMTNRPDLRFGDAKPPEEGGWPGLRPGSAVVAGMLIERDVAVTMRDGARIYVDVCRPEGAEVVPVLLAYGPFGKHASMHPTLAAGADIEPELPPGSPFEAPLASYWVGHGYAVVYADPRGTWGSEGDATLFSTQEAEDGYDLVEWAGTQRWSNGRVGMSGVSYLAISQYRVAATRPPHLYAINPSEGISDIYREAITHGGILETQFAGHFSSLLGFGLGRVEDVPSEVFEHPFLDEFWQAKSPDLYRIEVPAFLVASVGNQGLHVRGTLEAFKRISSREKWLDVHGHKEWRYYYLPENMDRQRAFFDHFLKGLDTAVSSWPPVRVQYRDRANSGPIREEADWPIARTRHTEWFLDAGSGRLLATAPTDEQLATYDPTAAGLPAEAGEQRATFDLRFEQETDLAGHAALRLWVASPGAENMDLFVNIDKLDRSGRRVGFPYFAYLDDGPLAQGWLRASRRELDAERSTPEQPIQAHRRDLPLPAGEPVAVDIEIWPFTATFSPGETLRLTVAGADIERYPPQEFAAGHDLLVNTAPHQLHTGGRHPSRLLLPLIPRSQ